VASEALGDLEEREELRGLLSPAREDERRQLLDAQACPLLPRVPLHDDLARPLLDAEPP
jgi:hypothetical protein